ncbi:MAG TPA: ABC transporter substrate-binding protein [Roseiflexaceae bacterium]|nr:ABC transporter substrate-binding protein [Roseiflexaceae bacterium]
MDKGQKLSRRHFLRLSAVGAASTLIAACGGPAANQPAGGTPAAAPPTAAAGGGVATPAATTAPIAAPSTFKESPLVAEMVKAGSLPPVDQRLPKKPYVPPEPWLTTGKYGGVMQTTANWEWGVQHIMLESQYGHSPLRWLKDGLEIGPGWVESWEHNEDASKWTLHFREGIKWSDGEPFTANDVMYWWDDMINNPDYGEANTPPDEARSGKGTLAKFNKVDDFTLEMTFDAPTPLTADRLAMWVNGFIGPRWVAPAHYMKQFHPKYNTAAKDYAEHHLKMDAGQNPEVPTLNGWKLKQYEEGVRSIWERNPYYWAVDKEGNQLPYMDGVVVTGFQDKEVQKLAFLDGKVDWDHFHSLTLSDVSALKQAQEKTKIEPRFWDSGSGTASMFFFSQDYVDEKYRTLFRNAKFRRALSLAYNRATAQKSIYFNTGELTTGTLSPKAIEYTVNDQGKASYASWRDSASKYDPEAAKALLDEIGVKAGADGKRTFPDGSPLKITLDHPADAGPEHISKDELLAKDWQAIGIDAVLNPIPPQGYDPDWRAGKIATKTAWEVGDGPNHLVYPQWLVPIEFDRWAPLQGNFYALRGTPKVSDKLEELAEKDKNPWERTPPRLEPEKGGPIEKLWGIYDQTKVEPDAMKRHALVWDMIKLHIDEGPFFIGTVANYPRIILVKEGLMNVPTLEDLKAWGQGGFVNPWIHPTPAVYDTETWFFSNPDEHKA